VTAGASVQAGYRVFRHAGSMDREIPALREIASSS